jgi:predicted chitinase
LEETWHHPYGEAWWWQHHAVGMFSAAGTGRLVRIKRKNNGAKYKEILDENLL